MDDSPKLRLIAASDLPTPAPCCQRAHERGYRRGYRHGYVYALYDLGAFLRFLTSLWPQLERFLAHVLEPWVRRAREREDAPLRMELGPRFQREKARRQRGGA